MQALRKVVSKQAEDKKGLFDDDDNKVNLQITGIKLPQDHRSQFINM